ncbi:MAG: tripartite tricarboxylate transporter substrate binding protein [Thermodesulfobacteriota bacterium]|nr:tripartite tricarboxylate transporter substrate binding protein [Thermodesulfobacteriota bacterium]
MKKPNFRKIKNGVDKDFFWGKRPIRLEINTKSIGKEVIEMIRKKCIFLGVLAGLGIALLRPEMALFAQAKYPTKAIELVVAFSPGGGSDAVARIMGKYLSAQLDVPINIVNKPGGNQIPAVLSVLNARADGYILLQELNTTSSLQTMVKDLPYKLGDRTYGPMMVEGPMVIVANGKSPWNSLKDVIEAAKKDPSSFTWGRLGGTATADLTIMKLLLAGGVDITKTKPVGFPGTGPAVTAVGGGHIMLASDGAASVIPLQSSGIVKALAVTGDKRLASMPDVPTTKEVGFPSVDVITWFGISGPKDLPKSVVDRLDAAAKKVVENPDFAKYLEAIGRYPRYISPDQTRDYVFKEAEGYKLFFSQIPSK